MNPYPSVLKYFSLSTIQMRVLNTFQNDHQCTSICIFYKTATSEHALGIIYRRDNIFLTKRSLGLSPRVVFYFRRPHGQWFLK